MLKLSFTSAFFILLVFGSGFAGCERAELLEPEEVQATLTDIQTTIFNLNCAVSGCHSGSSPQASQNLSAGLSFSNIVNVQSVERRDLMRITPGDPENSYLFKKIRGDADIVGERMPIGRPALSLEEINLVRDWILDGAQDN